MLARPIRTPRSAIQPPAPTAPPPPSNGNGQTVTDLTTAKPAPLKFGTIPIQQGYNPRPPEKVRALLLAKCKQGKSTFLCSHPSLIVLDFEGGCNAVIHQRASIVPLSTARVGNESREMLEWLSLDPWERYLKTKAQLIEDAKSAKPRFATVAVDTLNEMVECIIRGYEKDNKLDTIFDATNTGAAWAEVRTRMMNEFRDLTEAGYGLIMACHLLDVETGSGDNRTVVQVPWMYDSLKKHLFKSVDQVYYLSKTTVTDMKKIPIKLPNGQTTTQTVKGEAREVVYLKGLATGNVQEVGCRVQIPLVEVPMGNGWEVVATAYREEVARHQAIP